MFGQHLVLAAVGVAALSLGGASAVSAERGGPSHGDEDTAAITATALTPESVCASPGTAPGVAQLCTLWSAHTLPERAQQMVGRVIVHLATPEQAAGPPSQAVLDRLTERCKAFMAEHPDATGPRAEFCKRVIAGTLTADDLKRIAREGHEDHDGATPPGERRGEERGERGRRGDERRAEGRGRPTPAATPSVTPTPAASTARR